jgi:hypothetical protein
MVFEITVGKMIWIVLVSTIEDALRIIHAKKANAHVSLVIVEIG